VLRWQSERKDYPVRFYSAGIPGDYAQWALRMLPEYSKLVGAQVPLAEPGHIALLARFLIRQISDLLAISGSANVVSDPILTRALLPQPVHLISEYR
jgi:hypothetical protein